MCKHNLPNNRQPQTNTTSALRKKWLKHLLALLSAIEADYPKPPSLRFIAVGGASVSPQLLNRAAQLGLPVYEGYGLSECASVVALNTPSNNKLASVEKPLPHVEIRFAADQEILVIGTCLLGYIGNTNDTDSDPYWPTGDIGHLDDEDYLYITARKKNQFITSFGRNVAPEWIERELTLSPAIRQAPARPGREDADKGRRKEAEEGLRIAESKL